MSPDVIAGFIYTAFASSLATFLITIMLQDGRRRRELRELRADQAKRDEERLAREREQREREIRRAREQRIEEQQHSEERRAHEAQERRWAALEEWKRSVDARLMPSRMLAKTASEQAGTPPSVD